MLGASPTKTAALLALLALSTLATVQAQVPAGEVRGLRGSAEATGQDGRSRGLDRGEQVFAGDVINTGSRSFVLLQFEDETRFALGQNATLEVNDFVYGQADREDNIATRVLKGTFRFVSGLIARRQPRAMRVGLGVIATIGLRGTNVGGEVVGDSAVVVLLEPEDGDAATGIDVSNDFGAVSIDEPGFGTEIPDANSPPSPPRRMRLQTIENLTRTLQSIGRISVPRPRPQMR